MGVCSKCNIDAKSFNCDSCSSELCEACSGLAASEIRCLDLKKRKLIFLCENCQMGYKQIPVLIKKIEDLGAQVKKIKEEKNTTENNSLNNEQLISEFCERQKRASNIIMHNVKEPSQNTRSDRTTEDKKSVQEILKNIEVDTSNISVFRLGKYDQTKNRPIKVTFSNPHEALNVLKNKKEITVPSIRIFSDQTKMQRDYFLTVKKKLQDLTGRGENKTIRYINNIPTIVDISNQQRKN